MGELFSSQTFVTHIIGLLSLLGVNASAGGNATSSIAVALITGITQAAHAYKAARTQPQATTIDTGLRMQVPSLTNAAGDAPVMDHADGPVS